MKDLKKSESFKIDMSNSTDENKVNVDFENTKPHRTNKLIAKGVLDKETSILKYLDP